ncbi:MAG: hypothetical protein Q9174_004130 [Haloplaca sp. 1 TL-2023]
MSCASQKDQEPIIEEWKTAERHYCRTANTFTKRQLKAHEVISRKDGSVAENAYNRWRIENELHALTYIAKHTTIPVPRVIEWSDVDGVGSLTVEAFKGHLFENAYWNLDTSDQERLMDNFSSLKVCAPARWDNSEVLYFHRYASDITTSARPGSLELQVLNDTHTVTNDLA